MPFRLVFFGTSEFAVPCLEGLIADPRWEIRAIITQPDRPVGRHQEPHASPVKICAARHGKQVLQFDTIRSKNAVDEIRKLEPDICVVISFGQIISKELLAIPPHGFVNVHGSILPKYRGASPINAAILAGDKTTGVTIMQMDEKLDHGPIIHTTEESIRDTDTGQTLHDRLALQAASVLPDVLYDFCNQRLLAIPQHHELATIVKRLEREDGLINWQHSANQIEHMVRAYTPWPGTYTLVDGKRLKILRSEIGSSTNLAPGITFVESGWPLVACAEESSLRLLEVQPEGKQPMNGMDYLRGKQHWSTGLHL